MADMIAIWYGSDDWFPYYTLSRVKTDEADEETVQMTEEEFKEWERLSAECRKAHALVVKVLKRAEKTAR